MAESKSPAVAELRTIATFTTPEEAEIARLALENEGIFTAFEGWNTVGMVWVWGNAVGWVKLQVPQADEERARAILAGKRPTASPPRSECAGSAGAAAARIRELLVVRGRGGRSAPAAAENLSLTAAQRPPSASILAATEKPEFEEPEENATAAGDKKAWRGLAAAIIGFFVLPPLLHVYSAWGLVRLLLSGEPLSRRGKVQFTSAALIDCAIFGLVGLWFYQLSPGRSRPAVPVAMPAVYLGSLDGPGLAALIRQKKGQAVLVDFWATWCPPCVALLPHTVALYDRFQARGLAVITVSLDEPEVRSAVLRVLVDRHATTENYLAPYGAGTAAATAFRIDGGTLPHVRLYDARGRLARSFTGDIRADEVRRAVEELLGKGE